MGERKVFFGTDWRCELKKCEYKLKFQDAETYFLTKDCAYSYLAELRDELNDIIACLEEEKKRKNDVA